MSVELNLWFIFPWGHSICRFSQVYFSCSPPSPKDHIWRHCKALKKSPEPSVELKMYNGSPDCVSDNGARDVLGPCGGKLMRGGGCRKTAPSITVSRCPHWDMAKPDDSLQRCRAGGTQLYPTPEIINGKWFVIHKWKLTCINERLLMGLSLLKLSHRIDLNITYNREKPGGTLNYLSTIALWVPVRSINQHHTLSDRRDFYWKTKPSIINKVKHISVFIL